MGFFDAFFSSVTGGSREPQKPSNIELELRRRLTVLASDEATQDAPQRYFLRWEGQVQASVSASPTPTSHKRAPSPAG